MFDRVFFERYFTEQVGQFAKQRQVPAPVVEFLLDDGARLFVSGVTQTTESWLSVTGQTEDGEARFLLLPYFSIRRIPFARAPPKSVKATVAGFKLPQSP